MMNDIVIMGAGGLGREVLWLIERINSVKKQWNILGFIDDGIESGTNVNGYAVLGGSDYLKSMQSSLAVILAIGNSKTRKKIAEQLSDNSNLFFPTIIDPSAILSSRITLGKGNIIGPGNIITVDIQFGDFNIINYNCTIGHDTRIASFVTVYPCVSISGTVEIGEETEVGTGSHIIQGIHIGNNTIIGAGTVVIRNIEGQCTVVGNPARRIK